jgi:hypothetical protein
MHLYYCGRKKWRGYMNRVTEASMLDALPFGKLIARVKKHQVYFVCRDVSRSQQAIKLKRFWRASRSE